MEDSGEPPTTALFVWREGAGRTRFYRRGIVCLAREKWMNGVPGRLVAGL